MRPGGPRVGSIDGGGIPSRMPSAGCPGDGQRRAGLASPPKVALNIEGGSNLRSRCRRPAGLAPVSAKLALKGTRYTGLLAKRGALIVTVVSSVACASAPHRGIGRRWDLAALDEEYGRIAEANARRYHCRARYESTTTSTPRARQRISAVRAIGRHLTLPATRQRAPAPLSLGYC